MAGSINKVILVGNVGATPEIRQMHNGERVVTFSLATSTRFKDKTGTQRDLTEWHRIVVFSPTLIDVIQNMVQRGTRLYIEGSLRTRKWQNAQGVDLYTTEIILAAYSGTLVVCANGRTGTPPTNEDLTDANTATIDDAINVMAQINDDIPF